MGSRIFVIVIFLLLLISEIKANNIGIPPIINYSKETYDAGTQNWDIAQDDRGVMYFANNNGLLVFNGKDWQNYPLENRTICRSVAIGSRGRIFVGGQGEIGYFFPDYSGVLKYHSLTAMVPEPFQSFEDVWDIEYFDGSWFFRTSKVIFEFSEDHFEVHDLGNDLLFMEALDQYLIIEDINEDVYSYEAGQFTLLADQKSEVGIITKIIPMGNDQILFATLKNAFFIFNGKSVLPWEIESSDFLKSNNVYSATYDSNREVIAVGTSTGGVLVLDKNGIAIRHLKKSNGLQNNNILSIFFDRSDNLWLGLNNGIDYVALSSAFSRIIPDGEDLQGPVYSAKVFNNRLYLGTSNGLYSKPWQDYYNPLKEVSFELVSNTSGQIWGLDIVNDNLFLGHHEGAFSVRGDRATLLSDIPGAWKFLPVSDELLISGCYSGLNLYRQQNGNWEFLKEMDGFVESSRLMALDGWGNLWVAHPYKGVFKITFTHDSLEVKVDFYGRESGLASDLFNHVFTIRNEVLFASERGIYKYDQAADKFFPYEDFNQLFGKEVRIKYLEEDAEGNIWFAADDNVGILKIMEHGLKREFAIQYFPELKGKLLGGFEMIYPYDEKNVFFGSDRGVYHLNPEKLHFSDSLFNVIITNVYTTGQKDSLIFGGEFRNDVSVIKTQSDRYIPVFPYDINGFRFHYSNNYYPALNSISYQYLLEGLDQEWSEWVTAQEKEYTNLPPGKYKFHIKARDIYGMESPVQTYAFEIKAPWYANPYAYGVYVLLMLGITLSILYLQRNKFTKEKAELELQQILLKEEHKKEVAESEREIVELRNENLTTQIQHKNKELASTTMHLVQKVEMLKKLQGDLTKVTQSDKDSDQLKREIQRLIRMLNSDQQLDDEWELFSHHFDEVHSNFLQRLSEQFPHLSPNDHRLCAYLRMNLSTKEIAHLLNLSVRGVEASRYRLRKKLDLNTEENLTEFMMKF